MLEIKDRGNELHRPDRVKAKNAAAKKWVAAVNTSRRFGDWGFEICRSVEARRKALNEHAGNGELLPFRFVEPTAEERFKTCVPLTSLRAAAGWWSDEQVAIHLGELVDEWVTFAQLHRSSPMFVV